MLKQLDDSDWAEVFGEGGGGNCSAIKPNRPPASDVPNHTFSREDVETIVGMSEGERDGRSWVVYGQLKDGRWFVARGSCDYTGWDCQAGNSGDVAATKDDIERYGLEPDERYRLGIALSAAGEQAGGAKL